MVKLLPVKEYLTIAKASALCRGSSSSIEWSRYSGVGRERVGCGGL